MRLLFVLPSFPFPPADGGGAKVFNILRYLSRRHECDLICFGERDSADVAGLRQNIPSIGEVWIEPQPIWIVRLFLTLANLMFLRPPSFARYTSCEISKRIKGIKQTGQYDAIHFDIINMAPYQQYCPGVQSIHSPNDATSLVYRRLSENETSPIARLRLLLISWLLARYESKHYADFSKIHVVSKTDRDYLAVLAPKADIEVIPITSGYPFDISVSYPLKGESPASIITVCGNLGDAGIAAGFRDFMQLVLPAISDAYPNLRVRVLGRRISASLESELVKHHNVEYLAWVDNFEEFLSASDVLLLPDKAGAPGAKTRAVQAMALGRAVVGSMIAFEGIPIVNRCHGALYSTPVECQELLLLLLGNFEMRKNMGAAAAKLAADEYSMDRIGPKYEEMYLQTAHCQAGLKAI